ncbi:paraquat-inducible protein A [Geomonas azotofigens]|uniref:paraquat-inducible protein A n=1 Tax=Geomonas azotofigens TaxID=2843196 RepID=UPI001C1137D5|nr:paraquat-inducible protein A [Geomonas azotofigens]MBU5613905.1 paraquat-inducible protein A [Geomonas azotofigens]
MTVIACHECDLLQRKITLPPGRVARCVRCGAKLYRVEYRSLDHTLALTVAAAIVFILANIFPIVSLQIQTTRNDTSLINAVHILLDHGMWPVAGLVFFTTFLAPFAVLAIMIHILLSLKRGYIPAGIAPVMRVLQIVNPWGMVEVFIIGVMVALVKLTHYGTLIPGMALWSLGVLTLLMTLTASSFDAHDIWNRVRFATPTKRQPVRAATLTAAGRGLLSCHVCGLLSSGGHGGRTVHCPRCSAPLHFRKPDSVARSWAFLVAAYILYIPANVLPIMETSSLFGAQADTILSGIIYLWHSGSWDLALVVFIASIMVPLLKLIALTLLLISVQRRSTWQPMQRAKLYRVVELVGRWSMLDIYVVAILAALVQIGPLATINAGPGALAFGAVVVLTMLSASEFDPRLIWAPIQKEEIDHE